MFGKREILDLLVWTSFTFLVSLEFSMFWFGPVWEFLVSLEFSIFWSGAVLDFLVGPPIKVWGLGFGPNQGLRSGVWALPEPEVWGLAAAQGTPPRPGCTYLQQRVVYWQDG